MKLWEIPRESKIKLTIGHADGTEKEEMCTYKHVDGMYSRIITEDGTSVNLGANVELKKKKDYYVLA